MKYEFNNFYELIEKNASKYPKKPAYFIDNSKITWRDFKKKVDLFSRSLEILGVKKNDKIPLLVTNSLEFVISYFAIQKLGAVVVPINTFLKEEEIEFILNDLNSTLLIVSSNLAKNVKNVFKNTSIEKIIWVGEHEFDEKNLSFNELLNHDEVNEKISLPSIDDVAVIIYTSGTTGKPKGAMLSYKNIFSNILGVNEIVKITKKDRFIAYLPMFHSFTMTVNLLLPLYSGSAVVIIKSVIPFSNIIKQTLLKRVSIFTGVPDVYSALSRAKLPFYFYWFNSIRYFISGAAPLAGEVLDRFRKKFKAPLLEGYGLSEASPVVAVNRVELQKPGSVGKPLPGVEVKIVDDELMEVPLGETGEIIVKGDNVMLGYYNREDATKETIVNGWLLTGDIGKLDEDGYLYILDRKKDLIISKGVNIYPREIEEVCLKFKGVKDCAVVGKRDDNLGEIPIAFVELDEDWNVDKKELKNYLKKHLANYKIPREIYFVENLPKNATGKILKRVLRENLEKYISD